MPYPTYETSDTDLAAYLMLEGLKYIEAIPDPKNPKKAVLRFWDEKNIALDLERNYLKSTEKQYQDCRKFLLKDVHRSLRS